MSTSLETTWFRYDLQEYISHNNIAIYKILKNNGVYITTIKLLAWKHFHGTTAGASIPTGLFVISWLPVYICQFILWYILHAETGSIINDGKICKNCYCWRAAFLWWIERQTPSRLTERNSTLNVLHWFLRICKNLVQTIWSMIYWACTIWKSS